MHVVLVYKYNFIEHSRFSVLPNEVGHDLYVNALFNRFAEGCHKRIVTNLSICLLPYEVGYRITGERILIYNLYFFRSVHFPYAVGPDLYVKAPPSSNCLKSSLSVGIFLSLCYFPI